MENRNFTSDAEWYFRNEPEADMFYDIFFKMCHKYGISWASATEKEKAFIEEVTRVTYEYNKAKQTGGSMLDIRPAFTA